MDQDLREILFALNAHDVEYVVVGGYAVSIYSEPRGTKNLDFFVRSNAENSQKVFRAWAAYGAPLDGITPDDFNNRPTTVFQIGTPPLRIDILQRITAVEFDEAWQDRVEGFLDGIPTHVISREHLIRNKLAVGRKQDILDVENIREAALYDPQPADGPEANELYSKIGATVPSGAHARLHFSPRKTLPRRSFPGIPTVPLL